MARYTFLDFGTFLYRRRVVVVITALSAGLTAWFVSGQLPAVYQATGEFFVSEPMQPPAFFSPDGGAGATSRELTLPVITQERERSYLGLLESVAVRQRVHLAVPEKSFEGLSRDADIEVTRKHIIRVKVRDADPRIAARTANAYVKALDDFLFESGVQRQLQTTRNMTDRLEQTRTELAAASKELGSFQRGAETADVPREVQETIGRRANMEGALEQARVQLSKVESQITSAKQRQLVDRLAEYEVERASLEAEVAERRLAVDRLTDKITAMADQQRKEEQLRADVARLQSMVSNLTQSLEESEAQSQSRENQVVMVREARPPEKPLLPLPLIDALVAAAVGLIGGIYLALLLEYFGRASGLQRRPRAAEGGADAEARLDVAR